MRNCIAGYYCWQLSGTIERVKMISKTSLALFRMVQYAGVLNSARKTMNNLQWFSSIVIFKHLTFDGFLGNTCSKIRRCRVYEGFVYMNILPTFTSLESIKHMDECLTFYAMFGNLTER